MELQYDLYNVDINPSISTCIVICSTLSNNIIYNSNMTILYSR